MGNKDMAKTIQVHQSLLGRKSEDDFDKAAFHRQGKKLLAEMAVALGFESGSYEIRSNLGGPAVPGEITLHGQTLYMQLHYLGDKGVRILHRTCKGRKDYTGGTNYTATIDDLTDPSKQERFLATLRRMAEFERAVAV
jgi:hypothetical protein